MISDIQLYFAIFLILQIRNLKEEFIVTKYGKVKDKEMHILAFIFDYKLGEIFMEYIYSNI